MWRFEIDYSSARLGISTVVLRTGYVIAVGGIFSLFALNLESIPNIVKLAGRHTLLIYVVHLVILYGSAWIPGLYNDYGQTLNIFETLLAVIVMFGLMFAMVWGVEKIKRFRRKKLADLKV